MQFVCLYCGPVDWNNKYSYSYSSYNHYEFGNVCVRYKVYTHSLNNYAFHKGYSRSGPESGDKI